MFAQESSGAVGLDLGSLLRCETTGSDSGMGHYAAFSTATLRLHCLVEADHIWVRMNAMRVEREQVGRLDAHSPGQRDICMTRLKAVGQVDGDGRERYWQGHARQLRYAPSGRPTHSDWGGVPHGFECRLSLQPCDLWMERAYDSFSGTWIRPAILFPPDSTDHSSGVSTLSTWTPGDVSKETRG